MTIPPDQPQYPGHPGNYPASGYGGAPPAQPAYPTRFRGRRAIQVGGALMILGLVLTILGGVLAGTKSYSKVNGFQRVAVKDGTGTVTFSHAGGFVAYYESSSVTDSTNQRIPEVGGTLTNQETNEQVQLETLYGNRSDNKIKFLHYDYHGHKGVAMWQFHIDTPGAWKVELQQSNGLVAPDAVVAFGPSIAKGVVIGGILAIIGVLLLIAGLITMIVGLVRRSRHRREVRSSGVGGFGNYGNFGGYGAAAPASAAGWPPPGGGPVGQPGAGGTGWPPAGGSQPAGGGWPPAGDGWPPPSGGTTEWPPPGPGSAQDRPPEG